MTAVLDVPDWLLTASLLHRKGESDVEVAHHVSWVVHVQLQCSHPIMLLGHDGFAVCQSISLMPILQWITPRIDLLQALTNNVEERWTSQEHKQEKQGDRVPSKTPAF